MSDDVPAATWLDAHADADFCYLTTTGRATGRPHTIEIWFGVADGCAYLLSGGGEASDWVRNLRADPSVTFRLGDREFPARARVVTDEREEGVARPLLAAKYQGWQPSRPLGNWASTALVVAIEPSD